VAKERKANMEAISEFHSSFNSRIVQKLSQSHSIVRTRSRLESGIGSLEITSSCLMSYAISQTKLELAGTLSSYTLKALYLIFNSFFSHR